MINKNTKSTSRDAVASVEGTDHDTSESEMWLFTYRHCLTLYHRCCFLRVIAARQGWEEWKSPLPRVRKQHPHYYIWHQWQSQYDNNADVISNRLAGSVSLEMLSFSWWTRSSSWVRPQGFTLMKIKFNTSTSYGNDIHSGICQFGQTINTTVSFWNWVTAKLQEDICLKPYHRYLRWVDFRSLCLAIKILWEKSMKRNFKKIFKGKYFTIPN